jgi:hypothetical protein
MTNVITVTKKELRKEWNNLFKEYPWLNGWEGGSSCESVFCCPMDPPDWGVIDGVRRILWMMNAETHVTKITKSMINVKEKHLRKE